MRILAIDIGSSSVKAAVRSGRSFGSTVRVEYKTHFDGVKVEAPAAKVVAAFMQAARKAVKEAGAIDAISFCTFSSGVVVTDVRGTVRAGAITHQDRRSVAEAEALTKRLGAKWLLEHTGNLPYPGGVGSSTLAWLRRHERGVFRGDYRIGQLSTLIGFALTGEWVIDTSQAAFLGLWDIRARRWSARICDAVGVKIGSLPRVVFADEILGRVTVKAARAMGIAENIPVIGGFVDSSAAVVQTPMRAGQLAHNAGSTDVLAMCVDTPHPAEGILTRPVGTGAGAFADRWLAVRTIAAGGSAIDWARRTLFSELSEKEWLRILATVCKKARVAGTVECVPAFAGERASIEQSNGATFTGVTLATGREDILQAIVRGLVQQSVESYKKLAAIHRPEKIVYVTGHAGALRDAIHRAWPGRHVFRELAGDSLLGLAELARKTLETHKPGGAA